MQHALSDVATSDLMCELARRSIAHADAEAAPRHLLKLACTMAFVLGCRQSVLFVEALRDCADELEHEITKVCNGAQT